MHVGVRGQPVGAGSLFLPCGLWGLNSDHRALQQAPLPAEPPRRLLSHAPLLAPGGALESVHSPAPLCVWLRVCRACKRSHAVLVLRIQVESTLERGQLFPISNRGDWDGRRITSQACPVDSIGSQTHTLCFPHWPKVKVRGG